MAHIFKKTSTGCNDKIVRINAGAKRYAFTLSNIAPGGDLPHLSMTLSDACHVYVFFWTFELEKDLFDTQKVQTKT